MALPHQKFREIIFLLLFAQSEDEPETVRLIMEQLQVSKSHVMSALAKAKLILEKQDQIDELLCKVLISYDLERIQKPEKIALMIGIYDLVFEKQIPHKIAIAETLRLTKKFGTPAAISIVLALLDAIFKLEQGKNEPIPPPTNPCP